MKYVIEFETEGKYADSDMPDLLTTVREFLCQVDDDIDAESIKFITADDQELPAVTREDVLDYMAKNTAKHNLKLLLELEDEDEDE